MKLSFKNYKSGLLISSILVLAAVIDQLLIQIIDLLQYTDIEIIRAPSNAAIISGLLVLHNKYLWKCPLLKQLVIVPNLNGRYTGFIEYDFDGQTHKMKTTVEIYQTASNISIRSYFNSPNHENTSSHSLVENIIENDGQFTIHFTYLNSGTKKNGDLDCHEGTNILKAILKKGKKPARLTGHYFTNRTRQTRGVMEVDFESRELKHQL